MVLNSTPFEVFDFPSNLKKPQSEEEKNKDISHDMSQQYTKSQMETGIISLQLGVIFTLKKKKKYGKECQCPRNGPYDKLNLTKTICPEGNYAKVVYNYNQFHKVYLVEDAKNLK